MFAKCVIVSFTFFAITISTGTTPPTSYTYPYSTDYTIVPSTPSPGSCCQFEDDMCDLTTIDWYWSKDKQPSLTIPTNSGLYLWTNVSYATIYTETVYIENQLTAFSISYYISEDTTSVQVRFQEEGHQTKEVDVLTYDRNRPNSWQTQISPSLDLCSNGEQCSGYFTLQVMTSGSTPFAVAVDNLSADGGCRTFLPCCYFDDSLICGFVNSNVGPTAWKWSSIESPTYSITDPGSPYVFFEMIPAWYNNVTVTSQLISYEIEIEANAVFRANIFARAQPGMSQMSVLQLSFMESSTGFVTVMETARDTSGYWSSVAFYCLSENGHCCQNQSPTCRGQFQLTAVTSNEGPLIYAIDTLEIDNSCNPFPG